MQEPEIKVLITGTNRDTKVTDLSSGMHELTARIGSDFHWAREMTMRFAGKMERTDHGIVNVIPAESYLESVISSEMNSKAPKEFLKAHAIISRSWLHGKLQHSHHQEDTGKICTQDYIVGWDDTAQHDIGRNGCHICNDDHCQRYQGITDGLATDIVNETRGVVLTDSNGSIIDARFSKCCGGHTELFETCWQDTHPETLEAFPDPYCDLSTLSSDKRKQLMDNSFRAYDAETTDFYRWETVVPKSLITRRIKELFNRDLGEIFLLAPKHRGPSGRIDLLEISGTKGTLTVGKELYIRRILSESHLLSSAFEVASSSKEAFHLVGRGWGHGVGLCQIGAARMALDGFTAEEILSFYYPGSKLTKQYT